MKLTSSMLSALTRQDVFDIVAGCLLRQNARATAFDGVKCMYRAPDGKRCAIGWVMPDEVYHQTLEFLGVRDLAMQMINTNYADAFARFLYAHMDMLRDLQEMHDARQPSEWPVALHVIAQRHCLNAETVTHCGRTYGRTFFAPAGRRPIAPAYLLDLAAIARLKFVSIGAEHGSEEREAPREVCCA